MKSESEMIKIGVYVREVVKEGYAIDLPEEFLPKHLIWKNWSKAHKEEEFIRN